MTDEEIPIRERRGKAILARAMQEEYCVLEFDEKEDGTTTVSDITEHVRQLGEMIDG